MLALDQQPQHSQVQMRECGSLQLRFGLHWDQFKPLGELDYHSGIASIHHPTSS